jgi:hypothetical protein
VFLGVKAKSYKLDDGVRSGMRAACREMETFVLAFAGALGLPMRETAG